MSVSKKCLALFQTLVTQYSKQASDDDHHAILHHLLELKNTLSQKPHRFQERQIFSFLATSAVILKNNPFFIDCCRAFLVAWQQSTEEIDCMADAHLNIKSDLDLWNFPIKNTRLLEGKILFLQLLSDFFIAYKANQACTDPSFQPICQLITLMHKAVLNNPSHYTNERIVLFLSSSALILQENPVFSEHCRAFLIHYHQATNELDCLVNKDLSIRSRLDTWARSNKPSSSLFFKALQEAINSRELVKDLQKNSEPSC